VALAGLVPPELWTLLLGLGLPLLLMALFTVAPLALPVVAVLWLARGFASAHDGRPRHLPPAPLGAARPASRGSRAGASAG
jgi:hypothetical protein